MTHLTDTEIVDLIEDTLVPPRAQHVAVCAACSTRTAVVRDAQARAREVDVPEPSPLFWEHLSARVRDGIQDVEPARPSWFVTRWVVATAMVAVIAGAVGWQVLAPSRTAIPAVTSPVTHEPTVTVADNGADVEAADNPDASIDTDDAWALVRTVADDLSWDDTVAAGLSAPPGAADRAAQTLTRAERAELVRLLETETKRPGA